MKESKDFLRDCQYDNLAHAWTGGCDKEELNQKINATEEMWIMSFKSFLQGLKIAGMPPISDGHDKHKASVTPKSIGINGKNWRPDDSLNGL